MVAMAIVCCAGVRVLTRRCKPKKGYQSTTQADDDFRPRDDEEGDDDDDAEEGDERPNP